MGDVTKIEWADGTLNYWIGCTQLKRRGGAPSACDKCYAMKLAKRFKIRWNAPPVRTKAASWSKLPSYQRTAARFRAKHGRRRAVFVNSLSDIFDKRAEQTWRDEAFAQMEAAPDVILMLLTKRPENVRKMVPARWLEPGGWPENVWLGVTAEAQDTADHRVEILRTIPARVRFLSMEPLFEEVTLKPEWLAFVSWVIIGGESGRGARPTSIKWVRSLIAACEAAGVPVLFKQWGEWAPRGQVSSEAITEARARAREKKSSLRAYTFSDDALGEVEGNVAWLLGRNNTGRSVDGSLYDDFPPEAERMAA